MTENQPQTMQIEMRCTGIATGKMRNDLDVEFVRPITEHFEMATDEGEFHGGESTAPPPLALFIGGLTGCIMTQIRAFAKRLRCPVKDLRVITTIVWDWQSKGRVYETAPYSLEIDIMLDSDAPQSDILELIEVAKKGCFIEQTLSCANTIRHRYKSSDGWVDA